MAGPPLARAWPHTMRNHHVWCRRAWTLLVPGWGSPQSPASAGPRFPPPQLCPPPPQGLEGHDSRACLELTLISLCWVSHPTSLSSSAFPTRSARWCSPAPATTLLSVHHLDLSLHTLESLGSSRRGQWVNILPGVWVGGPDHRVLRAGRWEKCLPTSAA